MAKFDAGGSPAVPYFGTDGRQEATEVGRTQKGRTPSADAGVGEAATEAAKRANRKQETNRTQAEPASRKAEKFDTKSHNAAEVGQGEPVGDPTADQPGTQRDGDQHFAFTKSTTSVASDDPRTKEAKKNGRRES